VSRKILLSLLVIGAVVAVVAGITYAIFSDNVASDDQEFAAGTVDIQVDGKDKFFDTTLDMLNMEPGNCARQTVRVTNVGTLPVDLWNWIYTWKPSTDPRPNIFACDPNPNCNMYVRKTLIAQNPHFPQDDEKLYPPDGIEVDWEDYELEACLPLCAGNLCQDGFGKMRMFFHAVQQSNLEGWDCVKLMYKEGPDWIPDPTLPKHGNKCYTVDANGDLVVVVNGYSLSPDMSLQLTLNGQGGCSRTDQILAGDIDGDGTSELYNAYYRGFWNDGTGLEPTCDPNTSGEGVYIFAHGSDAFSTQYYDPAAKTDDNGNFSGQWTIDLPCEDHHYVIKFLVKQDQSPWLEELDELDYQDFEVYCTP